MQARYPASIPRGGAVKTPTEVARTAEYVDRLLHAEMPVDPMRRQKVRQVLI
jgi:hypothetical protein